MCGVGVIAGTIAIRATGAGVAAGGKPSLDRRKLSGSDRITAGPLYFVHPAQCLHRQRIARQDHRHRRRVADLCRGLLAMQVLTYDPYLSAEEMARRGAEKVELDTLLSRADFVSINCR